MARRRLLPSLVLLLIAPLLGACAHTQWPADESWGGGVKILPKKQNLKKALLSATFDPFFYVPLVASALLAIDDWDETVSNWAVEETPIFRSNSNAERASDIMLNILRAEAAATFLFTPSGELFSREWFANKAKGGLVELTAYAINGGTTVLLKSTVGRERPDGSDTRSFTSGHASESSSAMTLANRNLDAIPMNRQLRTGVKVANVLLSSGTAWARVEAKKHFPTDVLVGAAMGRFFTVFIHDAWLLPDDTFYVDFTLGRNVFGMAMSWRF